MSRIDIYDSRLSAAERLVGKRNSISARNVEMATKYVPALRKVGERLKKDFEATNAPPPTSTQTLTT